MKTAENEATILTTYSVHDLQGKFVGRVAVNLSGENGRNGSLLGERGTLRNFRIQEGRKSMYDYWFSWLPLLLRTGDGKETAVKIAGFPSERDGWGYFKIV